MPLFGSSILVLSCRAVMMTLALAMGASFAHAGPNLVIKLLVVNPSSEAEQTAVVRSYLPKEIKEGDILRKGDLDVVFDAQQGSYYVYGEITLKPSEVWEQDIELRDIWVIPEAEIGSLRSEALKYVELARGTEFVDRVDFIVKDVTAKLDRMVASRKNPPTNPELKISAYRDDLKVIESIKIDLASARTLLGQAKPFSTAAVWGMILAIVVFLGLLGLSFYFVWYRQMRTSAATSDFYTPQEGADAPAAPVSRTPDGSGRKIKDVDQVLEE